MGRLGKNPKRRRCCQSEAIYADLQGYALPCKRTLKSDEEKLQRLARAAHKIAQHGDVGAVGADASCIDRKAKPFGLIEVDTGVIKLRQAETLRGEHTIQASRIYGTGRTMPLPWPPRQFVELLPIAFVPSGHSFLAARPF